jgi:hypothetical protein
MRGIRIRPIAWPRFDAARYAFAARAMLARSASSEAPAIDA